MRRSGGSPHGGYDRPVLGGGRGGFCGPHFLACSEVPGSWIATRRRLLLREARMKLKSVDRSISVQSSNVDLGAALPEHARQAILRVAGKYFGRLHAAAVHFSREGRTYRCTVNMQ